MPRVPCGAIGQQAEGDIQFPNRTECGGDTAHITACATGPRFVRGRHERQHFANASRRHAPLMHAGGIPAPRPSEGA